MEGDSEFPFDLIDQEVLPLLSQLIDLRRGRKAGHQLESAELARRISINLGHAPSITQEIYIATLLCHIGFIALPDVLIKTPYQSLSRENRNKVDRSAIQGAALLASTSFLGSGAHYVKHQYEHFNGRGYPDGLSGARIPIGSRIISLVVDYDDLQTGGYFGTCLSADEAKSTIRNNSGKKFDPEIVDIFIDLIREDEARAARASEVIMPLDKLHAGMLLAHDVVMENGLILLRKGKELSAADIDKLVRVNELHPSKLMCYVLV